jgi:8-oxo-dGTP diphosphatase
MKLFVGVKAIIVHEEKFLLIREAKYDEGTCEGKWDAPGGRINPEESLFQGLEREVMEESGLTVVPGKLLGVFETFHTIKGEECHIVRIYYECISTTNVVRLSSDHDQYDWVDIGASLEGKELVTDIKKVIELVQKTM